MNEILLKRIVEAAENHEQRYNVGEEHGYLYTHKGDIKGAVIYGALFALQNQWISVEEALPKENGWYLTLNIKSTSPNFADTCQWNAKGKYWYTELCGDVFLHERTHWMQIPSLKGGEK